MAAKLDVQIDRLVARRQAIWSGQVIGEPGECDRIARHLEQLYEERRIERAKDASGKSRPEIVRRAKLDTELERLMTGGRVARTDW